MHTSRLIAEIAADWVHEPAHALLPVEHADSAALCRSCASSDLVIDTAVQLWPHSSLHRLVAPIEEVVDSAVEAYLDTDRLGRMANIDAYRARLRTTARNVVDHALMHRHALLHEAAG